MTAEIMVPLVGTVREFDAQAKVIRQTAAGIYAWLPLGHRVLKKIEQIVAQTNKTKAETAKILGADIPGAHADAALTSAQARTENVNATMTELTAGDALALRDFMQAGGGAAFNFPPMAAASPPGALGLPPSEANGPPPF